MNFKTLSTVCRRRILKPLSAVLLGLAALWCTGAVHYTIWAGIGPVIFLLLAAALLTLGFRNRNYWYGLTGLELAVIVWFAALTPERQFRDTKWQRPWGRMPQTAFNGTLAAVRDIRDFKYRTPEDYDIHYIDGTYDIDQVRTVDVAVSHWDGMEKIAHTMLSFGFADGRYLALSMETRLPEGKEQGFLHGFYKQYEIIMVLATEEDLFKLRTDYRGEELYLYRTNATPEQARQMFRLLLEGADRLYREPAYYNSITQNCTTSLAPLLRLINPSFEGDIRLLLNGESDQLLYELGYLKHRDGESFPELKKRRYVNQYLGAPVSDYSAAIRQNL